MLVTLKALRREHGFRQKDIAKKLGVSKQLYSQLERNEVKLTYERAVILARLFNKTPDEIFLPDLSGSIGQEKGRST